MTSVKPNILFIVIDGMTREKFSSNQRTCKTPNIDRLIKRGCYFSQTVSSGSVTIPSMASIFSSLYPIYPKIYLLPHIPLASTPLHRSHHQTSNSGQQLLRKNLHPKSGNN